mmetsp:Transcript_72512/g.106280  ORF Transcript_72512/g.106280 Transcript_72512/m.106280 type:complete len:131 (+) Transcript_72512:171-563(+)
MGEEAQPESIDDVCSSIMQKQTQLECLNIRNWQLQQVLFAQLQSHLRVLTPEEMEYVDQRTLGMKEEIRQLKGQLACLQLQLVYKFACTDLMCFWCCSRACPACTTITAAVKLKDKAQCISDQRPCPHDV